MTPPRCGKPMIRYEKPGFPVLEDPVCGRPEGHAGRCRSEASLARAAVNDAQRWADRACRQRYQRRRSQRLHERLAAVVTAASVQAERASRNRAVLASALKAERNAA